LAERGAHIIALTPFPVDSPNVELFIDLLRSTTSNNEIYAEQCDLSTPSSIHMFCTRFVSAENKRVDAVIFAHEYQHLGAFKLFSTSSEEVVQAERDIKSLATFLMTTLLLPALLVSPVERDIRIINIVNRFYAAAAAAPSISFKLPTLTPLTSDAPPLKPSSMFLAESTRSLRSIILMHHLQRVLDALQPAAQVPQTENSATAVPVTKNQKSNITAVSVSPGISRSDTVARLLNANWTATTENLDYKSSRLGIFL
jgi:NAD(P)-dependent dehydrogenase (short-subunit alcohol dehydrogenase family)